MIIGAHAREIAGHLPREPTATVSGLDDRGARPCLVGRQCWISSSLDVSASISGRAGSGPTLDAPGRIRAPGRTGARTVAFPQAGYYEVWARATDDQGRAQPFAINWNGKGYLNNTMHRIALTAS